MKQTKWRTYAFWILLSAGIGALSGWLTREGIQAFQETAIQPPLSPPAWVFPVVWTILYIMMGISAARVSLTTPSEARSLGLNLFITQLIVNFFWSPVFFNAQAYAFALLWLILLWILVLGMILSFRKADPVAAVLQIPYLLWLTFALYLNYGIWMLN